MNQLTEPIISIAPSLVLAYDSDDKLDNKVDENIAVPDLNPSLLNQNIGHSRWRVHEKGLVEELISLENQMAKLEGKKMRKGKDKGKSGSGNNNSSSKGAAGLFVSVDEGAISSEDKKMFPLDLEETLKLYLSFVNKPRGE